MLLLLDTETTHTAWIHQAPACGHLHVTEDLVHFPSASSRRSAARKASPPMRHCADGQRMCAVSRCRPTVQSSILLNASGAISKMIRLGGSSPIWRPSRAISVTNSRPMMRQHSNPSRAIPIWSGSFMHYVHSELM
jgi:hypothetical protein